MNPITNHARKSRIANLLVALVLIGAMLLPGSFGAVYAEEDPPNPWFTAFPEQEVVEAWDWPLDAVVHLTIDDPNTGTSPDYEQDETVVLAPWGSGQHWVWFDFAESYNMKAGDLVTLTDGETERTHVVQNLSITMVDSIENTVAGLADGGKDVILWSWEDPQGGRLQVAADNSGIWAADFDDISFDLEPGYHVRAEVWDEAGNDTAVDQEVLPPIIGYHDYDEGDVPSWACNVGGWAMDPDSPDENVFVRILVDGTQVLDAFKAENYREDLEASWNEGSGGCPGGTCAFEVKLWDYVTHYETHEITVEAQDLQSEEWFPLNGTPKSLTCRTYDIYVYDTLTRETRQITALGDSDEYNPRWSPDGKQIVHDRVDLESNNLGINITQVETGVSTPLVGAENGNYPFWSPNGQWIAFNQGGDLYLLPPTGGEPTLVRQDAFMASWAPNSHRLVFNQPSDGSIRTMDLYGDNVTLVVERGNGPAWSPNGQWIAYELDGDLWKVRVDIHGNPLGNPIQLTGEAAWEGRPSWSNNSKTIAFHKGFDRDTDIWTIPAEGGMATWLTGAPGFADYDPNYSNNGRYIAYASFSPEGQAPRSWAGIYAQNLPAGFWSEGTHTYFYRFDFEPGVSEEISFSVSSQAELYEGLVLLRPHFLWARTGEGCTSIDTIHPDQQTQFHFGWVTDDAMTYPEALAFFENLSPQAVWDEGMSLDLVRQEILPFYSSEDWSQYVCTYTLPRPVFALKIFQSGTTVFLPLLARSNP